MARPILLETPPRDPRIELRSRLESAPVEHAEALLAAYEVLQGLHDKGILEILRGALGSSDQILEIAVDAANSPSSIRGLRNLFVLLNMLGSIDPERLATLSKTVPKMLDAVSDQPNPPGLWTLANSFLRDRDIHRALASLQLMLKGFGSALASEARRV